MKSLSAGSYFITGTDTDCGKTYVTSQLLLAAAKNGLSTLGLKPIAAGGHEDAEQLMAASTIKLSLQQTNPCYVSQPLSPHIAASLDGVALSVAATKAAVAPHLAKAKLTLLEGAGGVLVPINEQETMLDLMRAFDLPVILVVGMRLGCLNHAQLSYQVLRDAGLNIAGWIANQIDPQMQCYQENITTLQAKLNVPMLAEFTHNDTACQNRSLMPCAAVPS